MDELTADAFVNRDDPMPVVNLDPADDPFEAAHDDRIQPESQRDRLRRHAANIRGHVREVQGKSAETGSSVQDRLLEKYFPPLLAPAFRS